MEGIDLTQLGGLAALVVLGVPIVNKILDHFFTHGNTMTVAFIKAHEKYVEIAATTAGMMANTASSLQALNQSQQLTNKILETMSAHSDQSAAHIAQSAAVMARVESHFAASTAAQVKQEPLQTKQQEPKA